MAVAEDCEEDFGYFDTIEEAKVQFKKVLLENNYTRVVIFATASYDPECDNIETVKIVKDSNKLKKKKKLILKK